MEPIELAQREMIQKGIIKQKNNFNELLVPINTIAIVFNHTLYAINDDTETVFSCRSGPLGTGDGEYQIQPENLFPDDVQVVFYQKLLSIKGVKSGMQNSAYGIFDTNTTGIRKCESMRKKLFECIQKSASQVEFGGQGVSHICCHCDDSDLDDAIKKLKDAGFHSLNTAYNKHSEIHLQIYNYYKLYYCGYSVTYKGNSTT